MTEANPTRKPRFTVAHPTDLSREGEVAYHHALALAAAGDARLYSIHVDTSRVVAESLPKPDELLSLWAREGNEAALQSLSRLEYVMMNHTSCDDAIDTLLDAIDAIEPDMLVVGTHQRDGAARFIKESVSEVVANHAGRPTLFVPLSERGFVDRRSGRIGIKNVLIPVEDQLSASRGMRETQRLLDRFGVRDITYTLVHVGERDALDAVLTPEGVGAHVERMSIEGKLEEEIVGVAERLDVDLIAMPTRGHDSIRDWLLGSKTERVIRRAGCPVIVFEL